MTPDSGWKRPENKMLKNKKIGWGPLKVKALTIVFKAREN